MDTTDSLYDRIGGNAALIAVVDDLYRRILADPQLNGFFAGSDLDCLKQRQVEFFSAVLGGPAKYTGSPMRDVHRGLGIQRTHFRRVADHLTAALQDAGVPSGTVEEVMGLVRPLVDDISGR